MVQAGKEITGSQPTLNVEEGQIYDWNDQFDETLGLLIQLRNRVSNAGTPPVRASPRATRYGQTTGGATLNIGTGPGLYMVAEDARGN